MKIPKIIQWLGIRLAKLVFLIVWFVFLKRKVGLGKQIGLGIFWLMRNQQWVKYIDKVRPTVKRWIKK